MQLNPCRSRRDVAAAQVGDDSEIGQGRLGQVVAAGDDAAVHAEVEVVELGDAVLHDDVADASDKPQVKLRIQLKPGDQLVGRGNALGAFLQQAGVGTVIWLEGANDIGQTVGLTAAQLEESYAEVIGRMQGAGLRVLQGTLTPMGSAALPSYSSASASALRMEVNDWIRTQSPADGILDFDAAVRDPTNPNIIDPRYDGGDGLHYSAAGYQRMAEAVDLSSLRGTP